MSKNTLYKGKIANGPFEILGRSESWAEQRIWTVTVVGKWEEVRNRFKVGDSMTDHKDVFDGGSDRNYFIKNVNAVYSEGDVGEVQLTLVNCPNGKTKPYAVTWNIAMEEVQMKLINHPKILEHGNINMLTMWEDTDIGIRIRKRKDAQDSVGLDGVDFYYVDRSKIYNMSAANNIDAVLKVTGDWNIAYCKAVTSGITTYNRYLPVLTKTSSYLELDGIEYDMDSRMINGGKIKDFIRRDGIGKIAQEGDIDITIDGYTNDNGVWFNNEDSYAANADGTWTRTQSWVFTNDAKHKWIYTHNLED